MEIRELTQVGESRVVDCPDSKIHECYREVSLDVAVTNCFGGDYENCGIYQGRRKEVKRYAERLISARDRLKEFCASQS
jgi:hypothetical protein